MSATLFIQVCLRQVQRCHYSVRDTVLLPDIADPLPAKFRAISIAILPDCTPFSSVR